MRRLNFGKLFALTLILAVIVTGLPRVQAAVSSGSAGNETIISAAIPPWAWVAIAVVVGVFCVARSCSGPPPPTCWNFQNNIYVDTGVLVNDSDGGFKPCVGGTIEYIDSTGATKKFSDSCSGSSFVDEWYWNAATGKIHEDSVGCAPGFNCLTNASGEGYCG